ncbi:GAP family protein [Streptomyces sp. ZAF1911]|uniref:GAP family protein n=1 Tax=Streptomyces sp. ZAF1911 TaxID=2944129 RepID=UPI00237AB556|nr:GAP family protein [Streptomyces sp. ZAF1911]MDD9375537.1 GAP family protein [Streptomyces sp. ZAF1911]
MLLDLLVIGLVITLYPLPIMAFVLVLSAPGGVWKGFAFILAWFACLVAVIAVVILLTGGEPPPPRSAPSDAAHAAKLAIGIGLVLYGEHRRRRHRRAPASPAPSRSDSSGGSSLGSRMDRVTVWSAAGLALLLQPWGMVGAGAATVVEADLSRSGSYLALLAFCVLATSSLLAMELYMVCAPDRAGLALANLRAWLSGHKDRAVVVTCLVLGVWLAGRSLYELTR